jgi:hypothetical protein
MKNMLVAITLVATLIASGASAFDPEDVQKLKDTNECNRCDLSEANLTEASLYKADLSGADLRFAIMNGAILCNTTMPDGTEEVFAPEEQLADAPLAMPTIHNAGAFKIGPLVAEIAFHMGKRHCLRNRLPAVAV